MTNKPLPLGSHQGELYAAVDMGSNSFHLLVVRVSAGSVQIIGKIKQKVRLAAGLDQQMNLDEASMQRGWDCLKTFAERLEDIPLYNIKVVATATLRIANNAAEFIQRGEQILGRNIAVISGEEEARQIYLGVAYTSANQGNTLVIDIGGASTEVIIGNDMHPMHLVSLNMGCVTFMERYFQAGKLSAENFQRAETAAKAMLQPVTADFTCFDWRQCMGASGTPQAIVEILVTQGVNDAIRCDYLYQLRQQCIDCGDITQLAIEGLLESRRAIFPSGLAILIALFEQLGITEMNISGGALREGLIYGMLDNFAENDRHNQTLQQTMQRYHIELSHAMAVRDVALNLYQQMCEQTQLCNVDTQIMMGAAALLHEIGMHIEYKKHHIHGAYLLSHISLPGYTRLQKQAITDLVRVHRQEIQLMPFNSYHEDIRQQMLNMARILRLASLLCIRRQNNLVPEIKLTINHEHWTLAFPQGWLKAHPLIDAELANETWLQHKAGWKLSCE